MRPRLTKGRLLQHSVETDRTWRLIDGKGQLFGDVARQAAHLLMGKHKPSYLRGSFNYDPVVIINVGKVELTGRKKYDKTYITHSRYYGGQKITPYQKMMSKPEAWKLPLTRAIRNMMFRNENMVASILEKRLHLFKDEEHYFQNHPTIKLVPVPVSNGGLRFARGHAPTYQEMEDLWTRTAASLPEEFVNKALQEVRQEMQEKGEPTLSRMLKTGSRTSLSRDIEKYKDHLEELAGGKRGLAVLSVPK
eukprot:Plantae.Rhodophyta-Purpureofilum_apyrenoidigerum.ctg15381.p1 GENE.Plantae.Rhodophyta-Purpureofilum_apyrenoidigerum.ctg15381~~Plantae.Rhodophyta-Purpureofilum_apyrenoidigerum.ctg15381.p1  ORF type:complete len:249 (+),score=46.64 Plantae.Rhodophyta-Purpureofilum_apyrenoidigerum.ctg15381:187-933(+)